MPAFNPKNAKTATDANTGFSPRKWLRSKMKNATAKAELNNKITGLQKKIVEVEACNDYKKAPPVLDEAIDDYIRKIIDTYNIPPGKSAYHLALKDKMHEARGDETFWKVREELLKSLQTELDALLKKRDGDSPRKPFKRDKGFSR